MTRLTPQERREIKLGKRDRIRGLLVRLRPKQLWRGDSVITKEQTMARSGLVAGRVVR